MASELFVLFENNIIKTAGSDMFPQSTFMFYSVICVICLNTFNMTPVL